MGHDPSQHAYGNHAPNGQRSREKSPQGDTLFELAASLATSHSSELMAAYHDGKRVVAMTLLSYVQTQLEVARANVGTRTDYASGVYDTLLGVVERCERVVRETGVELGVDGKATGGSSNG